nr:PREDICTED: uncharacterized protein LOC107398947 [Tribolium castaneum]|eukprot:XP_015840015.1 PREDICTED: uncharacterized protein LOC107398947 [Tribolium castaneum]
MEEEKDKFETPKKKFEDYFVPKKNLTYCRHRFFSSRQGNESIEQFVTDLKNKAKECELGNLQDELIKTMLITGMKDEQVREKLLQKDGSSLTLEKAIECCIMTENARQQLKEMKTYARTQSQGNAPEIDAINKKRAPARSKKYENPRNERHYDHFQERNPNKQGNKLIKGCSRCGRDHPMNNCPAYGKICNLCKKPNHFANFCKFNNSKRKVNEIEYCNDAASTSADYFVIESIDSIENNISNPSLIDLEINNKIIRCKIDSGASANVISKTTLINLDFDLRKIQKTNDKLVTFTGQNIPLLGKCYLKIKFNNKSYETCFYVEKGSHEPIIGIHTSVSIGLLTINEEIKVIDKKSNNYVQLTNKYKDIFFGYR